jgi:Flp pilus assembly pilin Flp
MLRARAFERGASAVEYGLIAGLIAGAIALAVSAFGEQVVNLFFIPTGVFQP